MQRLKVFSKSLFSLLLLFGLFVGGCASKRSVPPTEIRTVHDTVTVTNTVILRDTVLGTAPAQATMTVKVRDLNEGFNKKSTDKNATAQASVKDGNLKLDCTCDSISIYAQLRDRLTNMDKQRTTTITKEVPVQVRYTKWYVSVLAWFGGASLLVLTGSFILKQLKITK